MVSRAASPPPGEARRAAILTVVGVVLVTAFVARVGCARDSADAHRDAIDARVCASATGSDALAIDAFAVDVHDALRRAPGDLELRLIHAATSAEDDDPRRAIPTRALVGDFEGARDAIAAVGPGAPPGFAVAWSSVVDRWAADAADGCRNKVNDR